MMEKVILYGAHGCPMCAALGEMLKYHGIKYEKNEDTEYMIQQGFDSIPMLELENGDRLNYGQALKYLNNLGA